MNKVKNRESGFALILALLALLLLTSLGLSLSTTTGTELQISTNHRWSESARYNAEAGLDFGKEILSQNTDFSGVLPPARTAWSPTTQTFTTTPTVPPTGSRSYENYKCDTRGGGMGYGLVLGEGSGTTYQYMTTTTVGASTFTLNGAYTLWVRRPMMWSGNNLVDYTGNDVAILTSEGVAPYAGAVNATALAASNRAVYTMEALISISGTGEGCQSRSGQAGGGAQGTNSYGCIASGSVAGALSGRVGQGTGNALP